MRQSDLTISELLTSTSRLKFGVVARARRAYLAAVRLRVSHPGELTERKIAEAETALRSADAKESLDIERAAKARAADYATLALNRPQRRA